MVGVNLQKGNLPQCFPLREDRKRTGSLASKGHPAAGHIRGSRRSCGVDTRVTVAARRCHIAKWLSERLVGCLKREGGG